MNGLNNLDNTDREYSLAATDDFGSQRSRSQQA